MTELDSSFDRDAELHDYATSDLSVEEQLAGGASIEDLTAAGVLYDDYNPDDYDYTPLRPVQEVPAGPPMPEEEFEALKKRLFRYSDIAAEFRKNAARQKAPTPEQEEIGRKFISLAMNIGRKPVQE